MDILAQGNAQILDIGQSDIHSTLCLGILFRIDEQTSGNVMKNLLFKATELGVNIEFEPIGDEEYEKWVDRQGKNRYILTIIGRGLSASQIAAATDVVTRQELNIDAIRPSEHRPSAEEHASLCGVLIAWQSPRPRGDAARTDALVSGEGDGLFFPEG